MYRPDLSPWNGVVPDEGVLKSVGYLSKEHPFPTGALAAETVERLQAFVKGSWRPWVTCGHHKCEFCPPAGPWTLENTSSSEIWLPAKGAIFVAPLLIFHYVEAHNYQPPDEFVLALMACPPQLSDEWRAMMKQSSHFRDLLTLA